MWFPNREFVGKSFFRIFLTFPLLKPLPMKAFQLSLLLGLLPVLSVSAQGDFHFPVKGFEINSTPALQDQTVLDSLQRWEEHITLHTDRRAADPGDYLFFKAYATTGPKRVLYSPSGVLKVELLNAEKEVVSTQYYPLQRGTADGAVQIPEKLEPGAYTLRAYTRWMRNFGAGRFATLPIAVGLQNAISDENATPATVEFQPEGGSLLAGLPNRLAIVTRDARGCGVAVNGVITNASGTQRIPVQSYGTGYASALFAPQAGESYVFQLNNGDSYSLPEVSPSGYALRVNNLDPARIRVQVAAAGLPANRPVTLLGRQGLQTYFEQEVTLDANRIAELDIPTAGLPAGTLDLVLFDAAGQPQASRPVQLDGAAQLRIEMLPMAATPGREGETAFRLRVTDAKGTPVQTSLSLAVSQAAGLDTQPTLSSLSGPAAGEGHAGSQNQARFLNDLKTLGAGSAASAPEIPDAIRYRVQSGLELHAKVYDLDGKLLPDTPIQMLGSSESDLVVREARTDASGVLHIENLQVEGETQFVFRTPGDDLKSRLVKLEPLQEERNTDAIATPKSRIFEKEQRRNKVVETTPYQPYDTTGLIKLRQATVNATSLKKEPRKIAPSVYGVQPDKKNIIYQDPQRPLPLLELIRRIPGMMVQNEGTGNPVVQHIRNLGQLHPGRPMWVLDGQILGSAANTGYDATISTPLFMVADFDIERVEFIINSDQTGVFGINASAGVILLYTRSGSELRHVSPKQASLNFKGYQPRLDFDTYLQLRQDDRQLRKTASPTLYWNPAVETDANGEAVVRFTNTGATKQIQVKAETVTPDGRVGSLRQVF